MKLFSTHAIDTPYSEDTKGLISEEDCARHEPQRTRTCRAVSMLGGGALVVAACVLSSLVGLWLGRRYPSDDGAIRHVSKYSPMMDDVDINFHTVQFNGTFTHENIYRQDASPEVDAAWQALGVEFRPVVLTDSVAMKAGLTKDHARIKDENGGGYTVFVEGLHQLHCLNLLRQSLFYNYEYYHLRGEGAFSDPEDVQRWHVSHCLDFLRQRLMCSVDIGVFGSVWVQNKAQGLHTFVDFNTQHTCRDFEAVRSWAEKHQLPEDASRDLLELPKPGTHIWNGAP